MGAAAISARAMSCQAPEIVQTAPGRRLGNPSPYALPGRFASLRVGGTALGEGGPAMLKKIRLTFRKYAFKAYRLAAFDHRMFQI
jgi:hypothetical protein